MRYALSFSGGKDSMLALDRAVRQEIDIAYLFTIHEGSSGRVRFHGTPAGAIAAQAASLGIPLIQDATTHGETYETVFMRILDRLGSEDVGGIIFGNIHLTDIRDWYEERVRRHGFQYIDPLWGTHGLSLLREVYARGYRATLVSIDPARTPRSWLGQNIDDDFVRQMEFHPGIDPCGELGEYHTFVCDGPLFARAVPMLSSGQIEIEGHLLMDFRTS